MRIVKHIFIGIVMLVGLQSHGQIKANLSLKNWYIGEGIIFPFDHELRIDLRDVRKRFTPSLTDVNKAEFFLLSNSADVKYVGLFGIYEPSKLKKKLRKYNRQYVGYQNAELDTVILLNLLNFSNKKYSKTYFEGWENEYVVGLGPFYERNCMSILVNFRKKEVLIK
jgi:hypothetical protein